MRPFRLITEPVLRRGRSTFDSALLPVDEFQQRLAIALRHVGELGADALVVIADAHDPSPLTYLTNFIPTTTPALLFASPKVPPVILAGKGGARDNEYVQSVTWIDEVRYYPTVGEGVLALIEEAGGTATALATVGFDDACRVDIGRNLYTSLATFKLFPWDDQYEGIRRTKRPREVALLAKSYAIARAARDAAVQGFLGGASQRDALIAAEHLGRVAGCHDVRSLIVDPRGYPSSLSEVGSYATKSLSAAIAVEYLGYWGFSAFSTTRDPASKDAGIVMDWEELSSAGVDSLGEFDGPVEFLESDAGRLVSGIGYSLSEGREIGREYGPLEGEIVNIVAWRRRGAELRLDSREYRVMQSALMPLEDAELMKLNL